MRPLYFLLISCLVCHAQELPQAIKKPVETGRFGLPFTDNYRWLEAMDSPETKAWVEAQNAYTDAHFAEIRKRRSGSSKIKMYDHLSSNSLPQRKGRYFYARFRSDRNKPASLYLIRDLRSLPEELVNPWKLTHNDKAFLMEYEPSADDQLMAYNLNTTGSDITEIRFARMNGKDPEDVLKGIRFSGIAWNGNKGLFYLRNANRNAFERDSTYTLYYHRLGTPQSDDKVIMDATSADNSLRIDSYGDKLLIVERDQAETRSDLYAIDLRSDLLEVKPMLRNNHQRHVKFYRNGMVYFSSSTYDWGDLRAFPIDRPEEEKVIIPQVYTSLLLDVDFISDYIICKYKSNGKIYMAVHDKDGQFVRKFDLPYSMNFSIRFFDPETSELFVSLYSYVISPQNYKLNLKTGKTSTFFIDYARAEPALFPFDYFETRNTTYKSRDGEDVPITIIYKKGTPLNGHNPTLLEAYGGFGVSSQPSYDTGLLYFLEKGGVYAYADIRGGGDKGAGWHRDAMGVKKIRTFLDFIDAAQYLIDQKYTEPSKLAITGASQGGLLVGTALTMRPDLFAVAVAKVGVYDMENFHRYSVGRFHLDEYGNPEIEGEYKAMMSYSPYQHISETHNYPVTLILTGQNDNRVPPFQSYKFAAALQNRAAQKNPVYLRVDENVGHYGNIATYNQSVKAEAEFYDFLLYHLQ